MTSPALNQPRPGRASPRAAAAWEPRCFDKSPLFWPIRRHAEAFAAFSRWPAVEDYNRALGDGFPVRFREQPPKGRRRRRGGGSGSVDVAALYDARIHVAGWVPTRPESWHDFLNMLVWAAFPRAKAELHARQHRAMAARLDAGARTLPNARTREQDGLALLDEGGLLLLAEARAAAAVASAPEARLSELVQGAVQRGEAAVLLFGHALYQCLVEPGPPVYAMMHAVPLEGPLPPSPEARVALADAGLCEALRAAESFSCPERFHRLPLDARVLCGA